MKKWQRAGKFPAILTDHSFIAEGEQEGMPLEDYIAEHREAILGEQGSRYASFPILCKFIDAKQKLSIQVHPDDAYAKAAGMDNGKTELWYIVECDEDVYIYFGVNRDMTKEEFKRRIEENTVLEVLNKVPGTQRRLFPSGGRDNPCDRSRNHHL